MRIKLIGTCLLVMLFVHTYSQVLRTQVLVIGGGTGGVAAGIQSARNGANTIIAEETEWLGGMLSAAGVSATDGNHNLNSGIWQEFRNALYAHYQTKNLGTGWVSNTLFEPHVADSIFKVWCNENEHLTVKYRFHFINAIVKNNRILGAVFLDDKEKVVTIYADVVIDATELGDVLANTKLPYSLGMEADTLSGEQIGLSSSNNIIQDLTYAAILKDYGSNSDHLISRPESYSPAEFDGACTDYYKNTGIEKPTVDAKKMLDYGKLPHNKYMINWPKQGNDAYLNIVELDQNKRVIELEKAKAVTLRFIYFIQNELGFKNLGLANDEFPTKDGLPLIPYYREGRRMVGLVRLTSNDIISPYNQKDALYRTGISVGDYPIDQHHGKNPLAPKHLRFPSIPSFSVPAGALLNNKITNLIAAEKAISVTNVVNGTTRLQPCVMLTGQAAGFIASEAAMRKVQPTQLSVRSIQELLLNTKAYIMPYVDVKADDKDFITMQKIGATGILRGTGISVKWSNQTWFYPDSLCESKELNYGLISFTKGWNINIPVINSRYLTIKDLCNSISPLLHRVNHKVIKNLPGYILQHANHWRLNISVNNKLSKREVAIILDHVIHPFELRDVDWHGNFKINN